MPAGRQKSRTFRRIYVRTPKARARLVYKRRKPGKAQCADCGAYLKGTIRATPSVMKNTPKTKKRPQRPFGGVLCSRCMRKKILEGIRKEGVIRGNSGQ